MNAQLEANVQASEPRAAGQDLQRIALEPAGSQRRDHFADLPEQFRKLPTASWLNSNNSSARSRRSTRPSIPTSSSSGTRSKTSKSAWSPSPNPKKMSLPHPKVDSLQVQQLRAKLRQDDLSITDLSRRQTEIQEQITQLQGRLQASPVVEQQLKEITRNYQTAQDFYNELAQETRAVRDGHRPRAPAGKRAVPRARSPKPPRQAVVPEIASSSPAVVSARDWFSASAFST